MTHLVDSDLGRISLPFLTRTVSYPNSPIRKANSGEIGIFVAKLRTPVFRNGKLAYDLVWNSVSHNERVDAGAQKQSLQVHGGGGSPGAPSATAYFKNIAVANASLTVAKTDLSLGSASANVTTNEFTTIGLSRAAATLSGGNYTAPSTLGGTFSQVISYQFTASGGGTAYGAGVFDSTTVSGSILYVEANFASNAIVANGDTLTVQVTITN